MMEKQELRNAIYKKYIQPTKRPAKDYVGVEFELPIVNLDKKAVDFSVVHQLADRFVSHFSFDDIKRDDEGNIFSAVNILNGDGLSFDCSYNTLEISFGKISNLNTIYSRFQDYYAYIQSFLLPYRHTLTGMGINPYREYNLNIPVPSERYRMLLHHLESYQHYKGNFHHYPEFGLFSCASQVQLDVEEKNIIKVLNTFSKLEPLKSLLFANSPLDGLLCSRDYLWKNSLHGLNPHNVDGYGGELDSLEDLISYIEGMSLYCTMRDGKYINFAPTPLDAYFSSKSITGEYWNGTQYETVTFSPKAKDLEYLRSFKFEDLTFRGTVEFRSVCAQPVSEIMVCAAFHAGLMQELDSLAALFENDTVLYHHGLTAGELRALFNKGEMPQWVNENELRNLLCKIIDLSAYGLKKRGYGEEHFLAPLYHRAEHLYSPAKQMRDGMKNGVDIEYYIKEYAAL